MNTGSVMLFASEKQAGLPGRTYLNQQPAIEAKPASGLPGEDQENGENEHDGIDTGASSHHEIPVHETAKEGKEPGDEAKHERNANHQLANYDQLGKPGVTATVEHELNERAIPIKGDSGPGRSFWNIDCALPEAFDGFTCLHPGGVAYFAPARGDPGIAEV